MESAALVAALGDTVAVLVHGVVGYRWAMQQLRAVGLPASSLFGDADVGLRVFQVTWHAVTAVFAVSAAALYLVAFDAVDSADLLRFITAVHLAVLLVGLAVMVRRLDALLGRIPPVFVTCMTSVTVGSWLASR
jgi:hypothetical protein